MKPQRKQTLILIGLVLLLVSLACDMTCPQFDCTDRTLTAIVRPTSEAATYREKVNQTLTAESTTQPTSQETPLPGSQLPSTTAVSAEATPQIVLGTGTFIQSSPNSMFPDEVPNGPMKLVISSATNVVVYYTGSVGTGFIDALGKADLDHKIVTITSCNWLDETAQGTIEYSSGTLTGEIDCFYSNGSLMLKITMP